MRLFVNMGEKIVDSINIGMANMLREAARAGQAAVESTHIGAASSIVGGSSVSAPVTSTGATNNVRIDFGGQRINNVMDAAEFRVLVERTVRDLL